MKRKLIIDGNAVYEIDEDCMVRKCLKQAEETKESMERKEKMESEKEE